MVTPTVPRPLTMFSYSSDQDGFRVANFSYWERLYFFFRPLVFVLRRLPSDVLALRVFPLAFSLRRLASGVRVVAFAFGTCSLACSPLWTLFNICPMMFALWRSFSGVHLLAFASELFHLAS